MKQVIIIRKDLKMRRGKEIAQGAHASGKFLLDAHLKGQKLTSEQMYWATTGMKKVCCQVSSEQEMIDLYEKARDNGLTVHLIMDSGLTEFNGVATMTAIAIGPNQEDLIDIVTGNLQLY